MYLTPEVKDNYIFLENTPRKICLLIGLKLSFYKIDTNTELAQVVEVIMAQTKRIHILMIKENMLFSFLSQDVLRRNKNMFSIFLSSFNINLPAC